MRSERSSTASKARRDEGASEGTSNRSAKRKNKKQWHEDSLMAAADHKGGWKPVEGTPNHFEKLLEGPCPNRTFPVKHLLKDCSLMRRFLSRGSDKGSRERTLPPPWTTLRRRMMAFQRRMTAL